MNLRQFISSEQRRKALEKYLNVDLKNISYFSLDESVASSKNCENMIGASQIPLGVAGPLKIRSLKGKSQNYFIPLSTTEGALVASVSRGCKAITESGGATSYSFRVGQTRGPVFEVKSLEDQNKFYLWVKNNQEKLKKVTEQTSSHLRFKKAKVKSLANYSFVRFYYDTEDAMGMNMATIATQKAADLIERQTSARLISIAGNFDIDKKPAWLNFINNRGIKAWAECELKKDVVAKVLKTTPEKFFEVWLAKCMIGSAMSGSLGFNAQYANVIASLFIATGQDPAHVVEGSLGITVAKVLKNGNLLVSVYLPSLQIGVVGGGTSLATQHESLSIMRLIGTKSTEKFAEIIASSVLAGEISLIASLSEGTLVSAHKKLGRGEK